MRIRTVRRLVSASIIALGAAFITSHAAAGVPTTITHQGRLYGADDFPISKVIDVVFTIYDGADANGLVLWSEKLGYLDSDTKP